MLKKAITYIDYDGNERSEEFLFNLSQAETLEMELSISGGMTQMINKIIEAQDSPTIVKLFKDILLKAYGEKSLDGKRFIKSDELSVAFSQTEAYSKLFMELASNPKAAADFINNLVPNAPVLPAT